MRPFMAGFHPLGVVRTSDCVKEQELPAWTFRPSGRSGTNEGVRSVCACLAGPLLAAGPRGVSTRAGAPCAPGNGCFVGWLYTMPYPLLSQK
jgi:hypothetical protein